MIKDGMLEAAKSPKIKYIRAENFTCSMQWLVEGNTAISKYNFVSFQSIILYGSVWLTNYYYSKLNENGSTQLRDRSMKCWRF